jgi:hypothetical protein
MISVPCRLSAGMRFRGRRLFARKGSPYRSHHKVHNWSLLSHSVLAALPFRDLPPGAPTVFLQQTEPVCIEREADGNSSPTLTPRSPEKVRSPRLRPLLELCLSLGCGLVWYLPEALRSDSMRWIGQGSRRRGGTLWATDRESHYGARLLEAMFPSHEWREPDGSYWRQR